MSRVESSESVESSRVESSRVESSRVESSESSESVSSSQLRCSCRMGPGRPRVDVKEIFRFLSAGPMVCRNDVSMIVEEASSRCCVSRLAHGAAKSEAERVLLLLLLSRPPRSPLSLCTGTCIHVSFEIVVSFSQ